MEMQFQTTCLVPIGGCASAFVTKLNPSASGAASLGIDTDRVLLSEGAFTAKVKAKLDAESFTVESLPGIFTSAQIRADTFTGSVFENVSSVAALNVGDTVSLGGLLFKTAGDPVLVTEKVRKR